LLAKHEDELRNFPGYTSADNADFFRRFDTQFDRIIQSVDVRKEESAYAKLPFKVSLKNTRILSPSTPTLKRQKVVWEQSRKLCQSVFPKPENVAHLPDSSQIYY
jgi:hypothetical protein